MYARPKFKRRKGRRHFLMHTQTSLRYEPVCRERVAAAMFSRDALTLSSDVQLCCHALDAIAGAAAVRLWRERAGRTGGEWACRAGHNRAGKGKSLKGDLPIR